MGKKSFNKPEYFINRELSWLEFNDRVLQEGLSETVPLLERLKFLSITSSNLDEFFMIRVAGLMQQYKSSVRKRGISGLTPRQQLIEIRKRIRQLVNDQTQGVENALQQLTQEGICVLTPEKWSQDHVKYLHNYYLTEIEPVLTPIVLENPDEIPLLPGLQLYLAVLCCSPKETDNNNSLVIVPIPSQQQRFITVPASDNIILVKIEDVIAMNIRHLLPQQKTLATTVFRITRDADIAIQDDAAGDLLSGIERAVLDRRRRAVVRLEIAADANLQLKNNLVKWLQITNDEIYEIAGMIDVTGLSEIAFRSGFEHLKDPDWPPQPPKDLIGHNNLWESIQDHDILMFHPYESFDPVVQLIENAADDKNVLAIKQTLYRTSGNSPIIKALERAASSGKQVTVLVELKARFDEARNIVWARRLEDAGCMVIYGIAGYKTHSKALLIVRREANRIRRYVHLATGNYNDKTAKLYTDLGLMTCNNDIAVDVSSFFNMLTGHSEAVGWSELTIAPTDMRRRFIDLIEREIQSTTPEEPGFIMAKVNSLQDPKIIEALYKASRAGVKIKLNVRGICCLRPGLKKVSENIQIVSIVDRYLEHPRIFYFHNAGHEEIYLSSADWMTRNLDKRLEILFPVKTPAHRRRLISILKTYFADNTKACRLLPDGRYERRTVKNKPIRAQKIFYETALEAAQNAKSAAVRFQPLKAPE